MGICFKVVEFFAAVGVANVAVGLAAHGALSLGALNDDGVFPLRSWIAQERGEGLFVEGLPGTGEGAEIDEGWVE